MDTPVYVLMALVIGFSFSALTFAIGLMLGKMQNLSITHVDNGLQVKEEVEQPIATPEKKEIKKPTQSRVMTYPKPEQIRKQKAVEVSDVFFDNLTNGVEKTSGTMDAKGLI